MMSSEPSEPTRSINKKLKMLRCEKYNKFWFIILKSHQSQAMCAFRIVKSAYNNARNIHLQSNKGPFAKPICLCLPANQLVQNLHSAKRGKSNYIISKFFQALKV